MKTVLLPFAFNECSYLSSSNLVEMLKETDNYYYLDDINYLTIHPHEQVLCGYFPGTDPVQNFYYVIAKKDPTTESSELNPPIEIILNCRNFEYLNQFMDLICKQKPPVRRICINLPCLRENLIAHTNQSQTIEENLTALMKKHENTLEEAKRLYDFRFEDSRKIIDNNLYTKYRLTEKKDDDSSSTFNVYENDRLLFQYSPNVFSYTSSIFPSLRKPAIERLGMNVISFTSDVTTELHDLPEDAVRFCLHEISNIYLERGYVVKNIAFPTAFENEDICTAIGMTRYRQFVIYKTMF